LEIALESLCLDLSWLLIDLSLLLTMGLGASVTDIVATIMLDFYALERAHDFDSTPVKTWGRFVEEKVRSAFPQCFNADFVHGDLSKRSCHLLC
jgi:hypothetical protein